MVVPPKHPKMIIFSGKTNGCWVPPFLETPIYAYMVMFNVFYPWVSLKMAQLKPLRLKTLTFAQDSHLVSTNHGAWGAWETEVLPLPCGKTTHWYSWTGECQGAFYRTQWWELWSRSCEDATTKLGWLLGWLGTIRQFIDTFVCFFVLKVIHRTRNFRNYNGMCNLFFSGLKQTYTCTTILIYKLYGHLKL